jgi:LysM repeat protein
MVDPHDSVLDPPACPFLGLAGDPETRFTFPHAGHRCHADPAPGPVSEPHQASYCLNAGYATCTRYRAWELRQAGRAADAAPRSAGRRLAIGIAALGLLAVVGVGMGVLIGHLGGTGVAADISPQASASPQVSASASPSSSPSPVASASPSAAPTAAPSPSPSRGATIVHVVRVGESLSRIAARYGTTVAAIVAANGLLDPSVIQPGQELVIPVGSPAP